MEPPRKRVRLSAIGDPDVELNVCRARNDMRLKSIFESIFDKYGKDFTEVGDEIDLETGQIVVNNGHLQNMLDEKDVGDDEQSISDFEGNLLPAERGNMDNEFTIEDSVDLESSDDDPLGMLEVPSPLQWSEHKNGNFAQKNKPASTPCHKIPQRTLSAVSAVRHRAQLIRPSLRIVDYPVEPAWQAPSLPRETEVSPRLPSPSPTEEEDLDSDRSTSPPGISIWATQRRRGRPICRKLSNPNLDATWTKDEDDILMRFPTLADLDFKEVCDLLPGRTIRTLSERWRSLNPDVRFSHLARWSLKEERLLYHLRSSTKKTISQIKDSFPNRTAGAIAFKWHTMKIKPPHYLTKSDSTSSTLSPPNTKARVPGRESSKKFWHHQESEPKFLHALVAARYPGSTESEVADILTSIRKSVSEASIQSAKKCDHQLPRKAVVPESQFQPEPFPPAAESLPQEIYAQTPQDSCPGKFDSPHAQAIIMKSPIATHLSFPGPRDTPPSPNIANKHFVGNISRATGTDSIHRTALLHPSSLDSRSQLPTHQNSKSSVSSHSNKRKGRKRRTSQIEPQVAQNCQRLWTGDDERRSPDQGESNIISHADPNTSRFGRTLKDKTASEEDRPRSSKKIPSRPRTAEKAILRRPQTDEEVMEGSGWLTLQLMAEVLGQPELLSSAPRELVVPVTPPTPSAEQTIKISDADISAQPDRVLDVLSSAVPHDAPCSDDKKALVPCDFVARGSPEASSITTDLMIEQLSESADFMKGSTKPYSAMQDQALHVQTPLGQIDLAEHQSSLAKNATTVEVDGLGAEASKKPHIAVVINSKMHSSVAADATGIRAEQKPQTPETRLIRRIYTVKKTVADDLDDLQLPIQEPMSISSRFQKRQGAGGAGGPSARPARVSSLHDKNVSDDELSAPNRATKMTEMTPVRLLKKIRRRETSLF